MKNQILFFALSFALASVACAKKEQTFFENNGQAMDLKIKKAGDKIDRGLNKAGDEIQHGLDRAGEKVREATE